MVESLQSLWKIIRNPMVASLLVVVVLLAYLSFHLLGVDGARPFWGNLLLNVVAEVLGMAATTFLALLIARRLGQKKMRDVAGALAELVKQLRKGGTITPEAARATMVFSAKLIFEDGLIEAQAHVGSITQLEHKACPVCTLDYASIDPVGNSMIRRCEHCKLPGGAWDFRAQIKPNQ